MSTSQARLRQLFDACNWQSNIGTFEGSSVRRSYRGKGNWDVYLDEKYVGTVWFS